MQPAPDASGATPRIVPRDQHPISRKQISPNALRVLYRLREAGFGGYLVGGAVRDLLIGLAPKDFDVATDATPEQVRQLFRNCRLIGRRFRLAHVVFGREIIEVATFRAGSDDGSGDREAEDGGRLLRDNIYGNIEEDALRRDFTANALFYAIEDFSVRDYVGGFDDVQRRVLRLIGDPETRYREDPVRMLRAVRLAAKLQFSIEPATAEPIPRLAGLLADASSARLFDESLKLFLGGHGEASFLGLEQYGLLEVLLPDTHRALAADPSGLCRDLILRALRGTDARVREDKPVTPSFLFAALLWPAYAGTLQRMLIDRFDLAVAEQRAADRVLLRQVARIAIPRRFGMPMQELWWMQSRFGARQRKRVLRLLAHPRFRAAYDFLELRAAVAPELAEQVDFWREAQQLDPQRLAEKLAGQTGDDPPPRRRRRRRSPARSDA
ncbi:MAG: polynucleotide adenylyltransferase PcnB [Lysobacteraceae bacterium]